MVKNVFSGRQVHMILLIISSHKILSISEGKDYVLIL